MNIISILIILGLITYIVISQKEKEKRKEKERATQFQYESEHLAALQQNIAKARDELAATTIELNTIKNTTRTEKEHFEEWRKTAIREQEQHKQSLASLKQSMDTARASMDTEYLMLKQKAMNTYYEGLEIYNEMAEEEIACCNEELQELRQILNDTKIRVNAVNEQIRRERELAEKEDFFRIVITDDAKSDIDVFYSIRNRISHPEYLNKMIYDNYIAKPTKEMIKRVLKGQSPSGIYKITNRTTHESYVGKSTDISNRWCEHIKAASGLSGVADSQFQRALKQYGIDNWTFELLEEVPKNNLTEREKYYIDYYQTKEFGYNQRLG